MARPVLPGPASETEWRLVAGWVAVALSTIVGSHPLVQHWPEGVPLIAVISCVAGVQLTRLIVAQPLWRAYCENHEALWGFVGSVRRTMIAVEAALASNQDETARADEVRHLLARIEASQKTIEELLSAGQIRQRGRPPRSATGFSLEAWRKTAEEIRKLRALGVTWKNAGDRYGISEDTAQRWVQWLDDEAGT